MPAGQVAAVVVAVLRCALSRDAWASRRPGRGQGRSDAAIGRPRARPGFPLESVFRYDIQP